MVDSVTEYYYYLGHGLMEHVLVKLKAVSAVADSLYLYYMNRLS